MNGYQRREIARRLVIERLAAVVTQLHPDRLAREGAVGERLRTAADVERLAEGRGWALDDQDAQLVLRLASLAYATISIPAVFDEC